MWPRATQRTVTCIACGRELPREDAREYDKYGDRWSRDGKSFEFLCKPCFRDLTKVRRADLEADLAVAGAGQVDDAEFLARYLGRLDAEESDCE